jgi:hypothetical protein
MVALQWITHSLPAPPSHHFALYVCIHAPLTIEHNSTRQRPHVRSISGAVRRCLYVPPWQRLCPVGALVHTSDRPNNGDGPCRRGVPSCSVPAPSNTLCAPRPLGPRRHAPLRRQCTPLPCCLAPVLPRAMHAPLPKRHSTPTASTRTHHARPPRTAHAVWTSPDPSNCPLNTSLGKTEGVLSVVLGDTLGQVRDNQSCLETNRVPLEVVSGHLPLDTFEHFFFAPLLIVRATCRMACQSSCTCRLSPAPQMACPTKPIPWLFGMDVV